MFRLGLILLGAISLTACAGKQVYVAEKPDYCSTSKDIYVKNGDKVESLTHIECTDDDIKRLFHVKSGMAPNCGYYTYYMKIGGHDVERKGVSCQLPDGSWEVVNTGVSH